MNSTGAPAVERETVSILEAAQILGIGKSSIYEATKRNEIPHVRIGGRIVIPRRVLDRMLDGQLKNGLGHNY